MSNSHNRNIVLSSEHIRILEEDMCMRIDEIEERYTELHGDDAKVLTHVFEFLLDYDKAYELAGIDIIKFNTLTENIYEELQEHLRNLSYDVDSMDEELTYSISDLRHCIANYYNGGLRKMYVDRQPIHNYPRIYLDKVISTSEELAELPEELTIYRGMSFEEFEGNSYGCSWSVSEKVAQWFVKEALNSSVYEEGVVVMCTIKKEQVLYNGATEYNKSQYRYEKEIAVKHDSLSCGERRVLPPMEVLQSIILEDC